MSLQCGEYVFGTSALSELAVTMIANHLDGTLQIGLVGYEALAEIVGFTRGLQNLRLEV